MGNFGIEDDDLSCAYCGQRRHIRVNLEFFCSVAEVSPSRDVEINNNIPSSVLCTANNTATGFTEILKVTCLIEKNESPHKKRKANPWTLRLATVLSTVGACAMAASIAIQSVLTSRFPRTFNASVNVTLPFNATRTFYVPIAQRAPTGFGYGSWLNLLGFACLIAVTVLLIILLFRNRPDSA
jgi:hypothetical protein